MAPGASQAPMPGGRPGAPVHDPGSSELAGGVYSAVLPLAPRKKARPSGSSTPGPISDPWIRLYGSVPALTHWLTAGTYFCAFGGLNTSTSRTLWSGSRIQVSSLVFTLLYLFGPKLQLFATASYMPVWAPKPSPTMMPPSLT